MTKITKKSNLGLIELFSLCAHTTDENLRNGLLDLFLSDAEKAALSDRYWVIKALVQAQKPQRAIADELHVSIAKITRGSNELKRIHKTLLAHLKEKL